MGALGVGVRAFAQLPLPVASGGGGAFATMKIISKKLFLSCMQALQAGVRVY